MTPAETKLLADLRKLHGLTGDDMLAVYVVDLHNDIDDGIELEGRLVLVLAHLGSLQSSIALDVNEGDQSLSQAVKLIEVITSISTSIVVMLRAKPVWSALAPASATC